MRGRVPSGNNAKDLNRLTGDHHAANSIAYQQKWASGSVRRRTLALALPLSPPVFSPVGKNRAQIMVCQCLPRSIVLCHTVVRFLIHYRSARFWFRWEIVTKLLKKIAFKALACFTEPLWNFHSSVWLIQISIVESESHSHYWLRVDYFHQMSAANSNGKEGL